MQWIARILSTNSCSLGSLENVKSAMDGQGYKEIWNSGRSISIRLSAVGFLAVRIFSLSDIRLSSILGISGITCHKYMEFNIIS